MLSKLRGRARYCLMTEAPIYKVLGLLGLEKDLSNAFCCPNCRFFKGQFGQACYNYAKVKLNNI